MESTEMDAQTNEPTDKSNLTAFEGNLFGTLFGFHEKAMDLLRNSGLDDDKLKLVSERIGQLLADATAEMERTKNLNLAGPLDSVYEEVKNMVDELTEPNDSGGTRGGPDQFCDESG
jgi:hypothetical protein